MFTEPLGLVFRLENPGMVKTSTSQNLDKNLLQMIKLLKICATVTIIERLVTESESALNI